jgi:hypothetical protein
MAWTIFRHIHQIMKGYCFRKVRKKCGGRVLPALLFLTFAPAFFGAQQPAQAALDLDGKQIDPLTTNRGQPVVLIFVREDCPVSGRYAPTIQQISREHQKDARFYLVFPDKSQSPSDIRDYLRDFRYSIPGLRDPQHTLVKRSHAEVTPEAAVFDAKGALVYHGRIDNLYETVGNARPAANTHELEDAIQAVLAGRAPLKKAVASIGCYISDLQ